MYKLKQISKHFTQVNNKKTALQSITLAIEQGDVFGIIGPSGAGKSTLLRILAGLLHPSSGSITFLGEDISLMEGSALKKFHKKIGMIFQHFNLFSSRTVEENIAFPLEIAGVCKGEREQRVSELLHIVGLADKRKHYTSFLSGGEKQRVGIARALANSPDVLLCDEATSALDPKTKREILALLQSLNQTLGITIILITHDMEVIERICKHVAVLEDGKLIEMNSVQELFQSPKQEITKQLLEVAHV